MLDWKILAAAFAALLVVSSVMVGGFWVGGDGGGEGNILSGILEKINELLGTSPLTGLMSSSGTESKLVRITLFGDNINLKPESPVNLSLGGTDIRNFDGEMELSEVLVLRVSGLEVSGDANNITIEGFAFGKAVFQGVDFNVEDQGLNVFADNSTLEVSDFSGKVRVFRGSVLLEGNVSMVKGNHKVIV
jgi:hypothetical protein